MADAAVAGGRLRPVVEWRAWLFRALADRLAAEGERRLLWLPVFFGAGIGVYFVLKVEPPLWPGIAAAAARRPPTAKKYCFALAASGSCIVNHDPAGLP